MKKFLILFSSAFLFALSPVHAQLTVSGGYTAQQLAQALAGPNITVFNATYTGSNNAGGKFNWTNSGIGLNGGIILTSGDIQTALGPNTDGFSSTANGTPGDAVLDNLAGGQTFDASVLQFQFQVQSSSIEFSYVFASDEYLEFVNQFNDVFGFFISGPGITGQENIALVPNTTSPVSINTINDQSYWQYYIDNPDSPFNNSPVGFDGYTTVLKAKKTGLIPCQTYTLRLSVADAFDEAVDTWVLLKQNSLVQGSVTAVSQTATADSVALEGCTKARFTFNLDVPQPTNTDIKFSIGGTAINGVDYSYIDSVFTILAGQTSASVIINALNDGITEGRESVILTYSPQPCAPKKTVKLYIDDRQNLSYTLSGINPTCNGGADGQILIAITGGLAPYLYNVDGLGSYTTSPITNVSAGTYTVHVSDAYGCKAGPQVVGSLFDAGQTFLPDGNGQSYTSSINISGFNTGQTLTNLNQLVSVCAKLEHSSEKEVRIELIAPNGTTVVLKQKSGSGGTTDFGEPVAKGPIDGANPDITPGKGYDYCWTNSPTYGTMNSQAQIFKHTYVDMTGRTLTDYYLPAGSYVSEQGLSALIGVPLNGTWTFKVTDTNPQDNGYIFNWSISLQAGNPDSIVTLVNPPKSTATGTLTQPTCGLNNGAISVSVSGGNSPYTYLWSNGATTQNLTNVGAGTYTLNVTEASGCNYNTTFLLNNSSALIATNTVTAITCVGANNGAIDLTVSGGTTPYSYSWNNGSTKEDLTGLSAGTYIATITDNISGCKAFSTAIVLDATPIQLQATITNESCGNSNGNILLTASGGTGTYTYIWNNGSVTKDLNFIAAGTYTVTVKDANNCTKTQSYTLINEVNNCFINCNIAVSNTVVTPEMCGNANGVVDITLSGGVQPFRYTWSNGATTQDLSAISAGTYTVTVKDANNCSASQVATVTNDAGTLVISNQIVTNETCGNKQGAIDITISGGTLPYTFVWSNGKVSEDISVLNAGTYSVKVTDANNCSVNKSFTVLNNAGTLTQTYGNVIDAICGQSNGSIDITVVGGFNLLYQWSNGTFNEDLRNVSAGTYSCTITDLNNGCKINTPVYTVANNSETLAIKNIYINNETCGNTQGRVTLDVTGGQTPYTYLWNTGATTVSINGLSAGTYSCTVTGANGCSIKTGSINILNLSGTLALNSVAVTDEICNNSLGSINVTISGGKLPYSYAWNNGAITEDLFNLKAGSFSCVITDSLGCLINASATINNTSGTLAVSGTIVSNETCGNATGAINLMITGGTTPVSYTWSNGATTEDLTTLSAGIYTCQITDANTCKVTASATVTNQTGTLAIASTTVISETCGSANGSVKVNATGGTSPYTYAWSTGATTQTISNLSSGIYSCTVTDATSCKVITGNISVNNLSNGLAVSLNTITNESCGNAAGAITINVAGGTTPITYLWNNGATTKNISGLSAGIYSVKVSDVNGCSVTKAYTVINNSGTLQTTHTFTNEACGNGAGAINQTITGGTGTYTFIWNNGATTEDLSNLSAGTYSCAITDGGGCSVSSGNIVINNTSGTLVLDNVFVTNEQCGDATGSVVLTLSGGTTPYTYSWNNSATTSSIVNLNAGVYNCTVTDNAGCSLVGFGTVLNTPGTLAVSNVAVTQSTCGNNNGAIDLTITGGQTPYLFAWSNGSTTEDITALSPSAYSCIINDQNGCTVNKTATITNLGTNVSVSNVSVIDEACNNGNGSIDITLSGGTAPFTYLWSNGETTQNIFNLNAGTYTCAINDVYNCSTSTFATIANNQPLVITDTVITNASCATCANGSISLTIVDSNGTPFIGWSNGKNTATITNLLPGTYNVNIFDFTSGCQIFGSFVVSFTNSISETTDGNSFTIFPNPSTGIINVDYELNASQNITMDVTNLMGQTLIHKEYEATTKDKKAIDVNDLQNGIYMLRIKYNNHEKNMKIVLSK